MITRGTSSFIVLLTFVLAGCAQQPTAAPAAGTAPGAESHESPESRPLVPVAAESPAPADPTPGSAEALARRAQSYSRELEQSIVRRASAADGPRDAVPSEVQWIDPADFRLLGAAPPQPSVSAGAGFAQPVIQTSPSEANLPASIAPGEPFPIDGAVAANLPAPVEASATHAAVTISPTSVSNAGQLASRLAARVRDYPRDVSAHLEYQLLQFLLDEQVPQLSTLAALPTEDRELVTSVLDGLSLFRSTLRSDNNMLLSRKIRPLLEMADRLRSQADLMIQTVTLCRAVRGFGDYEPIEPARFVAGAEHKAILYCEIANFSSHLSEGGGWQTQLKLDLVLFTEFGVPVWNDRSEEITDVARSRRNDFFVNKRIAIPANLTMGRYLLKVSVVDVQANRVAEASVPIVIAAQ